MMGGYWDFSNISEIAAPEWMRDSKKNPQATISRRRMRKIKNPVDELRKAFKRGDCLEVYYHPRPDSCPRNNLDDPCGTTESIGIDGQPDWDFCDFCEGSDDDCRAPAEVV